MGTECAASVSSCSAKAEHPRPFCSRKARRESSAFAEDNETAAARPALRIWHVNLRFSYRGPFPRAPKVPLVRVAKKFRMRTDMRDLRGASKRDTLGNLPRRDLFRLALAGGA